MFRSYVKLWDCAIGDGSNGHVGTTLLHRPEKEYAAFNVR